MSVTMPVNGRFVKPEVVVSHFHLRPGDTVADFGAGKGFFVEPLAQAVGSSGRVFACEIQKNLVDAIGETIRVENLTNVEVLWCDLEAEHGIKITDNGVDTAVLVNTLFQIEDKPTALREMIRIVRPGGKFFVIDWSESFGGLGPHPDHVISEQEVKDLCESAGLVFERSFDAGDHHYGLAFRKA
ncbi:MAG: methyltransferase domain-containing protein [Candidatus Paceibacterota bacterium]